MLPRSVRPPASLTRSSRPDVPPIVRLLGRRTRAERGVSWTAVGALCFALACSSGGNNAIGPGEGTPATGSLTVTTSAPSGVTPSVTVSGPSGFVRTLTATQTLSGLAPGSYTIIAATSATADPIVGVPYSGAVTGSPATVVAGTIATASVTYAKRASAGLLWVSNSSPANMSGFTSSQLAASGSPTANATVNADGPIAMVIDAAGGAWVSPGYTNDTLVYYTQAELMAGGTPTASVRLVPASGLNGATAIALDARGDLWVAGQYSNTLVELTPDQLTKSGAVTPAVTISAAFGSIDRPFAIAFDAKGNLWVASINDSSIVAFSPSSLSASGEAVPIAGINHVSAADQATSMAFDSAGNLWVAGSTTFAEFGAKDLASIASPVPAVTITLQHGGQTGGLAFDDSGNLWVSDVGNSQLLEYTPALLAATGAPTPATVIASSGSSLGSPQLIAFSPHAINLPLH